MRRRLASNLCVLVLVLSGCGGGGGSSSGPPTTRNVSVTLTGTGTGTVASAPSGISCGSTCTKSFPTSGSVTLTATAGANSVFTGWSGACSGTSTTCIIAAGSSNVTATAQFDLVPVQITVTLAGTGTGSVSSAPSGINCGATCSAPFNSGTVVTLTAAASASSSFTGWSGGGCTGTGTCVITANAATTVTATFTLVQHTMTVAKAGLGTGTVTSAPAGINCGADCTEAYNQGTVVTLTAASASGSQFAGWSGAGCSGTGTCVVTMSAAANVTATFNLVQFTLTVAKAGAGAAGGTVTASPGGIDCGVDCSESYTAGLVVTLTATTTDASVFAGWTGGPGTCGGGFIGTCTATMNAAVNVTATFNVFQQAWPDESTALCSDGTTNIACPGGPAGQDGHYLINVPTYLVTAGHVRDQVSGLTWERNPAYTQITQTAATAYCNGLTLDGLTNWRLPTLLELVSLLNAATIVPPFNTAAFPGIPQNSQFWTSTLKPGSATQYYMLGTNYPITSFADAADLSAAPLVRCVRGTGFTGSFTVAAGSVTASRTGRVWQSGTAPGNMNWGDALTYCEALNLDGSQSWRLPNAKELLALVDPTQPSPTISPVFASRPATTFWSSSPLPNQNPAYNVDFNRGGNPSISSPMSTLYSVRCVR